MSGILQSPLDPPHNASVMWSFDVFFVLSLHDILNKQSRCHWYQMPQYYQMSQYSHDTTVMLNTGNLLHIIAIWKLLSCKNLDNNDHLRSKTSEHGPWSVRFPNTMVPPWMRRNHCMLEQGAIQAFLVCVPSRVKVGTFNGKEAPLKPYLIDVKPDRNWMLRWQKYYTQADEM